MYLVSLKSRQTASFLCISGDCHVYIYFIIACKKHLNRNGVARTPTDPLYRFSPWMVDRPSDKSTKSISDTLSPGLLGNPTNCTNSPVSIHCRGTGCSLGMAQWKLILTEISNRIQKQPLSQSANSGGAQRKQSEEEDEGSVSFTGHTALFHHWSVDPSITSCLFHPSHHYILWAPVVGMGVGSSEKNKTAPKQHLM